MNINQKNIFFYPEIKMYVLMEQNIGGFQFRSRMKTCDVDPNKVGVEYSLSSYFGCKHETTPA